MSLGHLRVPADQWESGFLTLVSLVGVANLRRWSQHRVKLLSTIAEEQAHRRTNADLVIVGLGGAFTALTLLVF